MQTGGSIDLLCTLPSSSVVSLHASLAAALVAERAASVIDALNGHPAIRGEPGIVDVWTAAIEVIGNRCHRL